MTEIEIYLKIKREITKGLYAYDDQIAAISKWIAAEFEPKNNEGEKPNVMDSINQPYLKVVSIETERKYNPNFGDNKECKCGHDYHRHFDSYEGMEATGCKYCGCNDFEEA